MLLFSVADAVSFVRMASANIPANAAERLIMMFLVCEFCEFVSSLSAIMSAIRNSSSSCSAFGLIGYGWDVRLYLSNMYLSSSFRTEQSAISRKASRWSAFMKRCTCPGRTNTASPLCSEYSRKSMFTRHVPFNTAPKT